MSPEAPRTPPTPASARGPAAPPYGGVRADQSGVDVTDEIRTAQEQAEAVGNAILFTSPELPHPLRVFGFDEAPADSGA
jgi:hypothetical protein